MHRGHNRVVARGGGRPGWVQTGLARHYPLFMARDLKGRMDECARQMGLHRVQCIRIGFQTEFFFALGPDVGV